MGKIELGIAPIGWTNDDLPDLGGNNTFEQCVSEIALAGFAGTEIGSKFPRDIAILRRALDIRGLRICNAWFGARFTTKPADVVIAEFIAHRDFLYAIGAKVIGAAEVGDSVQGLPAPVFDAKPVYTDDKWQAVINGFNRMADLAADRGMRLACHHHMGTGVQTVGEIDRFMDGVNENVWLLYDTGHIAYSLAQSRYADSGGNSSGDSSSDSSADSGGDTSGDSSSDSSADFSEMLEPCLSLLRKYAGRIAHVHLKDVRPQVIKRVRDEKLSFLDGVRLGAFTVPGDGALDFSPVFRVLKETGYEGWAVVEAEQDPEKANPLEYALLARKYICDIAGI